MGDRMRMCVWVLAVLAVLRRRDGCMLHGKGLLLLLLLSLCLLLLLLDVRSCADEEERLLRGWRHLLQRRLWLRLRWRLLRGGACQSASPMA